MLMNIQDYCKVLEWDSHFFQKKIARLDQTTLTEEILEKILAWVRDASIDCLYFLADIGDPETIRLAEKGGFHLVDIRMTYEVKLDPKTVFPSHDSIRASCIEDIPALRSLTEANHTESRFYFDGNFPIERCRELYATWIEKSCQGYADQVFVMIQERKPIGYITCLLDKNLTGSIGLFGLHPDYQGQGFGRHLLEHALSWFSSKNAQQVHVVTQGRNIQAQRFYQKGGFRIRSIQLWYHLWSSQKDS